MDVDHTAIWVSDLDVSRSFFVGTLGLAEKRSHTRRGITNLYVGGENGSIQLRFEPGREIPPPSDWSRTDHIALSTENASEICERVSAAADCEVIRTPERIEMLDVEVAFVRSPDGYAIELVER